MSVPPIICGTKPGANRSAVIKRNRDLFSIAPLRRHLY